MKNQLKQKNIVVNNMFMNLLSPMGLTFNRNNLVIGENSARVYGIIKYPQEPDYGWLSKLTNIPGTVASVTFKQIDMA